MLRIGIAVFGLGFLRFSQAILVGLGSGSFLGLGLRNTERGSRPRDLEALAMHEERTINDAGPTIRLSANLGFLWPDLPLLDRIDAAALAGFRGVELHWPYDEAEPGHIREACERHDLTCLCLNTVRGDISIGEFGLSALPHRRAEARQAVVQAIGYAETAGIKTIHVMAGKAAPRDKAARAALIETLSFACETAAARGMSVLIEPINQRDAPGYFYSTIEEADEIARSVAASNLKLLFDVYHLAVSEGDILRRLERFLPSIGHVQIASVPQRHEPDEGEIDYAHVLRALKAMGYEGWVGCEYRPRAATSAGLDWIRQLGLDR